MQMLNDQYLIEGFFRSLQWDSAKKTSAFKHKRKFRDAIREYLHKEYGAPKNQEEATEIEKAVGRIQFAIRSNWARKAAKKRARRKQVRKNKLIKKAEQAHKKYLHEKKVEKARLEAERSPMLFTSLPAQRKPPRTM